MAVEKPALVLLHGLGASPHAWQDVVPLICDTYEVCTPTAVGHRGGPPAQRRPVTSRDVIDSAERYLDEHGLTRPHLAGHSMGGFVAIELARRGRAATVCAFSPGGFWPPGERLTPQGTRRIPLAAAMGRLARSAAPLLLKSAAVRRFALRGAACHGDRLTPAQAVEVFEDNFGCPVMDDLLAAHWEIAPMHPLPCPITIAWSEYDAIIPAAAHGEVATQRLPQASFATFSGTGHVPMIDEPTLVAELILSASRVGGLPR
jgi:pimeloyl-ACP methyl ester carboxylesterase